MTDDTARRERAREWWANIGSSIRPAPDDDFEGHAARVSADAYLAGAREEAEIWEPELKATINEFIGDAASRNREIEELRAEIAALSQNLRECELEVTLRGARAAKMEAEIAALREELKHAQDALTAESNLHAESEERDQSEIAALRKVVRAYYDSLRYEGASDACLMIGINESVVRRALEEKP